MIPETIQEISHKYDIDENIVSEALYNLETGTRFITISGKIGAGKDTIAPLVLQSLNIPSENTIQTSFAYYLKKEIQDIIDILRDNPSTTSFEISEQMNILETDAALVKEWLQETIFDPSLTSYSRTQNIRKTLQYWGTEVRRTQDPDYWVKKCLQLTYSYLAEGKSVYITDVRFPNEADAVQDVYGKVIRLNVSPEVQESRIKQRDGLIVSDDARNHPSETALDDYTNFTMSVDTDLFTPAEIVDQIVNSLIFD